MSRDRHSANSPTMRYNIAAMLANRSTSKIEPSTPIPLFMEGSVSKCEPSTPKTHIVDGSIENSRTFHAEDPYHGRFMPQKRTFHAEGPYRGRFMPQKRTFHARGRYHGRFASLKSAYYTWQRKCLRTKHCQSLTGNIQYSEKLNIRIGTYPRQKSSARRALRRAPRNA